MIAITLTSSWAWWCLKSPASWLFNRLFKRRSKKTAKLRVTGLCEGNSPVTGEFPPQRASNAENVSNWWRQYEYQLITGSPTDQSSDSKRKKPSRLHNVLALYTPHYYWYSIYQQRCWLPIKCCSKCVTNGVYFNSYFWSAGHRSIPPCLRQPKRLKKRTVHTLNCFQLTSLTRYVLKLSEGI